MHIQAHSAHHVCPGGRQALQGSEVHVCLPGPGFLILSAADGLREMTAAGTAGVLVYIDRRLTVLWTTSYQIPIAVFSSMLNLYCFIHPTSTGKENASWLRTVVLYQLQSVEYVNSGSGASSGVVRISSYIHSYWLNSQHFRKESMQAIHQFLYTATHPIRCYLSGYNCSVY